MRNHLELAGLSKPVPSESNPTAPSAKDQGMTQTPPNALDRSLIGQEFARIEGQELLECWCLGLTDESIKFRTPDASGT
jgi:hypothetical protein